MRSMTGFGRGDAADGSLTLEISSVNRKQLEIRFHLPRELAVLEAELRPALAAQISRGSISLRLSVNDAANPGAAGTINRELLTRLVSEAREAARALDLKTDLGIADFLPLPGVIAATQIDADAPEFRATLDRAMAGALANFNAMREAEGKALADDLTRRIAKLEALLGQIADATGDLPEQNRQRLLKRLADARLDVDPADERMMKEVIFYVDRGDTTEEVTRLTSHFGQFRNFLDDHSGPVGRSMDFLLQEMFREITTLGNKAPGGAVPPMVVEFKTELEKIREQVQNIE